MVDHRLKCIHTRAKRGPSPDFKVGTVYQWAEFSAEQAIKAREALNEVHRLVSTDGICESCPPGITIGDMPECVDCLRAALERVEAICDKNFFNEDLEVAENDNRS